MVGARVFQACKVTSRSLSAVHMDQLVYSRSWWFTIAAVSIPVSRGATSGLFVPYQVVVIVHS